MFNISRLTLYGQDNLQYDYTFGRDVSSFVKFDYEKGISIEYLKRGNILQTVRPKDPLEGDTFNVNLGSMARHTLIQLCGYAAFMELFIEEDKYPVIPILVIDHISKPFSDENAKSIGCVLEKFLDDIGNDSAQIFMFDDIGSSALGIDKANEQELVDGTKTGFNPFYTGRV